MYSLEFRQNVDRIFSKLSKKNRNMLLIIEKKVKEILENPHMFKPLKHPLQNLRRVHIDKSFVLIFSINEERKAVILEDFDHHDNIYSKPRNIISG